MRTAKAVKVGNFTETSFKIWGLDHAIWFDADAYNYQK